MFQIPFSITSFPLSVWLAVLVVIIALVLFISARIGGGNGDRHTTRLRKLPLPPGPFCLPFYGPLQWGIYSSSANLWSFHSKRTGQTFVFWIISYSTFIIFHVIIFHLFFSLYIQSNYINADEDRAKMFREWSRKYGSDIVCISVWPNRVPIVAINSYAAVREALTSSETAEALAGRPSSRVACLFNPSSSGDFYIANIFTGHCFIRIEIGAQKGHRKLFSSVLF